MGGGVRPDSPTEDEPVDFTAVPPAVFKGYSFLELNPLQGLNDLQARHGEWAARNFGDKPFAHRGAFMGAVEECGELVEALLLPFLVAKLGSLGHSLLKSDQGIRGSAAEHDAKAQDAVADIVIFLMDLCNRRGWVMGDILARVAAEVHARDWTKKPVEGV